MTTSDSASQSAAPAPLDWKFIFGWLAYAAVIVALLVLAATGIGTYLLGKAPMTHWILMLHVSMAPLFAIGLALLSLLWAGRACFCSGSPTQGFATKALFWLILICGLVVILSGVVPMTPVFGTHGQHFLYLLHRYSAIVLTVAVALHLFRGGAKR